MTRDQVLKAARRAIKQIRADLGELEQILDSEAHAKLPESLTERMCRSKKAYTSAEAAGNAAASRGVPGLRIYECPLCKAFHLTSRAMDAFAGVEQ
jgi:hypothetical protein